jgi:hypothetical protein
MSAKTAPIGWRRTLAAICSGVGRWVRRVLVSSAEGAVAWRGARGFSGEAPRGAASRRSALRMSLASSASVQAAGDACEDQCDIGGTEAGNDGARVGEGALADGGREFAAIVDQLADQAEQVCRAAGLGWRIRGVGLGCHERNKNMWRRQVSRNIFRRLPP